MIPADLISVLDQHPTGLVMPALFSDGVGIERVRFYPTAQIAKVMLYLNLDEYVENHGEVTTLSDLYFGVEAYDLLCEVKGYAAKGVLVWIPRLEQYGSYDDDHGVMCSFPGVHAEQLMASFPSYLNALWYPDRSDHELVKPWSDERFQGIVGTSDPWG